MDLRTEARILAPRMGVAVPNCVITSHCLPYIVTKLETVVSSPRSPSPHPVRVLGGGIDRAHDAGLLGGLNAGESHV